jgi:2-polyprenyl-3-methyl-5-hydroxy-6-metoxy-1,4-benzoquinol methylase
MKEGSIGLWNYWARRYTKLLMQRWILGPTRVEVVSFLKLLDAPPSAVLDVGCGIGQLAHDMAAAFRNARVTGVDYAPEMIERAERENAAANIEYLCGRLEDVSGRFDVITSTHSFPYLPDKQAAASILHGLIRPGGRFLLASLQTNTLYDFIAMIFVKLTTWKAQYWSVGRLRRILEAAGFRIGTVRRIKPVFFMASVYLVEAIRD